MNKPKRQCLKNKTIYIVIIICIVVVCFVISMNIKNTAEQQEILEDSIKDQLISISIAAREIIDPDAFMSYRSEADAQADSANYNKTLTQLRSLAKNIGADYIYALKEIDGEYLFVFDTDPVNETIFIPYDISPVHEQAFTGQNAADVMNVTDEYGSFNTGAVPIYKDSMVIGIVSTDIEDRHLAQSKTAAQQNTILLVTILAVTLGIMVFIIIRMVCNEEKLQNRLQYLAHYDKVTGLPNRHYLFEYLTELTESSAHKSFALFFIDVDNLKKVNDNAGHDAGDELLKCLADYFNVPGEKSKSFRPTAGQLNVAARVGGDEFIQVVQDMDTEEQAGEWARHLIDGYGEHVPRKFVEKYETGISIGIALYPSHSENYHVLIKYADIAMYHAKHSGKNSYRMYNDDMEAKDEK